MISEEFKKRLVESDKLMKMVNKWSLSRKGEDLAKLQQAIDKSPYPGNVRDFTEIIRAIKRIHWTHEIKAMDERGLDFP